MRDTRAIRLCTKPFAETPPRLIRTLVTSRSSGAEFRLRCLQAFRQPTILGPRLEDGLEEIEESQSNVKL